MGKTPEITPKAQRPYTFDRAVRLLIGVAITIAVIWLIHRLSDALLPFFVAWLIAFILEPVVQLNRRMLGAHKRFLPVMLTLIEIIGILTGLAFLLAPSIVHEAREADALIATFYNNLDSAELVPAFAKPFFDKHVNLEDMLKQMTSQDWQSLLNKVSSFLSGGMSMLFSVLSWFITLLYLLFIMLDYDKLLHNLHAIVPEQYKHTVFAIFSYVENSIGSYFRCQTLIALTVGVLFAIGFLIVGLPMAIVMGLFIGLLNMVPYLQLISIPITTLLCLTTSVQTGAPFWPFWWQCMAVYVIVQGLQDLVITPKVMGKAMNLNPAIIFLSLSVWGTILGFVGLIIALPLTALLIAMYKEYVLKYYNGEPIKQRREQAEAIGDILEE